MCLLFRVHKSHQREPAAEDETAEDPAGERADPETAGGAHETGDAGKSSPILLLLSHSHMKLLYLTYFIYICIHICGSSYQSVHDSFVYEKLQRHSILFLFPHLLLLLLLLHLPFPTRRWRCASSSLLRPTVCPQQRRLLAPSRTTTTTCRLVAPTLFSTGSYSKSYT